MQDSVNIAEVSDTSVLTNIFLERVAVIVERLQDSTKSLPVRFSGLFQPDYPASKFYLAGAKVFGELHSVYLQRRFISLVQRLVRLKPASSGGIIPDVTEAQLIQLKQDFLDFQADLRKELGQARI